MLDLEAGPPSRRRLPEREDALPKSDHIRRRTPTDGSLLDLIIQTAPDAVVTVDDDGHILSFSPAAERIFGYDEDEVLGRNVNCLMPEPYRSEHDDYMRHYRETQEKRIIGIGREVRAQRKSGEIFAAELAVGELQFGRERIFTGFIRDISDRVEAERRARELQRTLDKVSRLQMLGEMSSAIAHEINQPLTAISNYARAAQRTVKAEEPDLAALTRQVEAIAEQALRAGEIVKRMRMMVERGRADIRPDDINDIIVEAVRAVRATEDRDGPQVALDLRQDLPPVLADRIQIQQVLVNLLTNAYEAMEEARETPVQVSSAPHLDPGRIELRAGANQSEIVVSVRDTGPGLTVEMMERMFDPLVTTKERGLGIGLAVCRSIVEAHDGRIWAANAPGGGAEIRFTLPTAGT
ncbi:two-component system sensor histidine kinase NtrB [Pontivivens ytuae]|uniref:Sensor protein FixL n=1 Tax=Pontivivens ytuae TaxID=2789856 RepID=A0A7S9LRT8_9RHOB|nr:PAS domain S-box protein [Pontivivens ytuae]QPH54122.1 PAS domain S-box protein [Pontivivens ytuae]